MISTLAKASFSYIFRWISYIILALSINIGLAIVYLENITAMLTGEHLLLGVITIATVVIFPIIWLVLAKKTALFMALFKVLDESIDDLVEYVVDKFLTKDNQGKIKNYDEVMAQQPKIAQKVLGYFFEKVDFFKEAESIMAKKSYSDKELKSRLIANIEEKEFFENLEPSSMNTIYMILANIAIVVIASRFL
jgi:hypothetical protein